MKLSTAIDLGRSLRQVFGENSSENQVAADRDRQIRTADEILARFFSSNEKRRVELVLLADEVGLGKTYVALAVAVTILDMIRQGESPEGLPANRPVALVLTPNNEALYNKWLREAEAFQRDCAREDGLLDWLRIARPLENSSRSGNVIDMTQIIRQSSRSHPVLLIAKLGALGAALYSRDWWRRRALACVFEAFKIRPEDRPWWCRQVLGSGSQGFVPELLDLRKASQLWADTAEWSPDLHRAYERGLERSPLHDRLDKALCERDGLKLADLADDLTREALMGDWPLLPLVIIDEVHGLKNRYTQARRNVERYIGGHACRVLGLSATPFQLRHDELLSVLELRALAQISSERSEYLEAAVSRLAEAMKAARDAGDLFRRRWRSLRPRDRDPIYAAWDALSGLQEKDRAEQIGRVRPPRVAHALEAAFLLEGLNRRLQAELRLFVIRHRHQRGYREHFVGRAALPGSNIGTPHLAWAPGMEVHGNGELAHYLMMRAVALAKEEKGLPGLGAELTGSYRHLIETSAVWRRLAQAKNPQLPKYRTLLEAMIQVPASDREHRKVQATVQRVLGCFREGQKTLVFCVYTKTAEAIRDELNAAIRQNMQGIRDRVFGNATAFENFRKRFFNRREPLYSLIQDHPLLARLRDGEVAIPMRLRMGAKELREVARLLVERGERPDIEKPDRRLILAAVEHVAVVNWRQRDDGLDWLGRVCKKCPELVELMAATSWLEGREPLSRRARARSTAPPDPEATDAASSGMPDDDDEEFTAQEGDAIQAENPVEMWVSRLCHDALGDAIALYFREDVTGKKLAQPPLLATHHADLLAQLDLTTRDVAGNVFRRILMAEEFLLRYLADVPREETERWADYLADRYSKPLAGHMESLRDRVAAYLETLAREAEQEALAGYHAAAENRNVVQMVQGGMANRDRYFLGFNTPYRPEILIATAVGQEGIDLHRECRHVIHHDLCWNPATIEQRTGRVDRIGSKVERERISSKPGVDGPTLEISVPYLAATYDERMFEELYRRAQLFEVTMGGDVRVEGSVEGRIEMEDGSAERNRRTREGIGTVDEDLGEEGESGTVDLPAEMVERLRVDLSVWKP